MFKTEFEIFFGESKKKLPVAQLKHFFLMKISICEKIVVSRKVRPIVIFWLQIQNLLVESIRFVYFSKILHVFSKIPRSLAKRMS